MSVIPSPLDTLWKPISTLGPSSLLGVALQDLDPVLDPVSCTGISPVSEHKKLCLSGAFVRAAEGARTLDLLHGKQTL